jgi:hypothetical protein
MPGHVGKLPAQSNPPPPASAAAGAAVRQVIVNDAAMTKTRTRLNAIAASSIRRRLDSKAA